MQAHASSGPAGNMHGSALGAMPARNVPARYIPMLDGKRAGKPCSAFRPVTVQVLSKTSM